MEENGTPLSGPTDVGPSVKVEVDRLSSLFARTKLRPYDNDTWKAYLTEALSRGDPGTVRTAYEALLAQFPTAVRIIEADRFQAHHWISYAEYEWKQRHLDKVEEIFSRCLLNLPSVELWRFYLNYVRKTHGIAAVDGDADEARGTISNAFEFVISNIGFDMHSASIWEDYISFIKAGEVKSTYEEQQKMDKLRKVYQQAILIPITNIEQLWKDYDAFENGLNKMTAKKFMGERSAGYMTARSALREVRNHMEPIEKISATYLVKPPTWTDQECKLRYLEWEKSNPLNIDDKGTLNARIVFAYKSCLLVLRYYPEMWLEATKYLMSEGNTEDATAFLQTGIQTMPTSLLLNFTMAEMVEARRKDYKEISLIFDNLISKLDDQVVEVNEKYDIERQELLKKLIDAQTEATNNDAAENEGDGEEAGWDGEKREREREKIKEIEAQVESRVENRRKRDLITLKEAITTAYVVYMRSEKAARQVFGMARKSANITFHVCVYSALMEYHCSKDATIARRVFEHSLKTFINDPEQASNVVLEYLQFLLDTNDDTNARAVFERALTSIPIEYQKAIWDKVIEHETNFGELALIQNLESRNAETFVETIDPIQQLHMLSDHFSFCGLNFIGDVELGIPALTIMSNKLPKLIRPTSRKSKNIDKTGSSKVAKATGQNLESVHPERYSKPDFSKWINFKADPSMRVEPAAPVLAQNSPRPASDSIIVEASIPSGPMVPPAVAAFMKKLPAAHAFTGPILPVDEILKLIVQLPVQIPSGSLNWVAIDEPLRDNIRRREDRGRPYDRPSTGRDDRRDRGGGGARDGGRRV